MSTIRRPLLRRAAATVCCLALAAGGLAGCADRGGAVDPATLADVDCSAFTETYGTFPEGTTVTIATPFSGEEAAAFDASLASFSECTGITIVQEGADTLEESLRAALPEPTATPTGDRAAEAGTGEDTAGAASPSAAPISADLAVVPQPGLIAELAEVGVLSELPEVVAANIELGWQDVWAEPGSVDGTLYAAPLMASIKSFVWYSPSAFAQAGYEVPATWDELLALTEQVAADHPDGDVVPWCVGASDGATTGWPLSDWLEDTLLVTEGTAVYDAWARHDVPLDDRRAVAALTELENLLLTEGHVAGGGQGAVTTTVEEAGEQLVAGSCLMLHASSSFETLLPEGTVVTDADATDVQGGVSAFLLPSADATERAVLVGGDYLVSLKAQEASDEPDAVTAVMSYLTSAQWAAERVAMGGVASANRGARGVQASSPVAEDASAILQSRQSVIRFDASDTMPSQVGTRALWDALVAWAEGETDAAGALGRAQQAWPEER